MPKFIVSKSYKYAHYLQIQNKKQLVCYSEPHPIPKAPAILGNVLSITSLKTRG